MAHLIVEDQVGRLAAEIAQATGQSISDVVNEALRERAERIPKHEEKASLEELKAIAHRIATMAIGPAIDHGEWLYDEYGLPK